jgi:hypothetical protein
LGKGCVDNTFQILTVVKIWKVNYPQPVPKRGGFFVCPKTSEKNYKERENANGMLAAELSKDEWTGFRRRPALRTAEEGPDFDGSFR